MKIDRVKLFSIDDWTLYLDSYDYLKITGPLANGSRESWLVGYAWTRNIHIPDPVPPSIQESMRAFIRLTQ